MTLEQELNIRYKKGHEADVKGTKKELAKALCDKGVNINIIAESTSLTPDEIKAL